MSFRAFYKPLEGSRSLRSNLSLTKATGGESSAKGAYIGQGLMSWLTSAISCCSSGTGSKSLSMVTTWGDRAWRRAETLKLLQVCRGSEHPQHVFFSTG